MGDILKTYQSLDNKTITTPFGEFTRSDGSRYIVTPLYLPVPRLNGFISISNYGTITNPYNADSAPFYGEVPYGYGNSASAGSYGIVHSLNVNISAFKKKLVPYCIIADVVQWSNQGTIITYIDLGATRVAQRNFHSDVGKNSSVTRRIRYKFSIFEDYYTPEYQSGHQFFAHGSPKWLIDYVSNPEDMRNLRIETQARWGNRGGGYNVTVFVYFGVMSELVDINGLTYVQSSYY